MHNAPLGRRLGAIIYDGLLVIALQLLGTVPFVALEGGDIVEPGTFAHQLTVVAIAWLFFCGFWTRAGRTLGMQSWRLQLETPEGARPGLLACTIRFFAAIVSWLPLGFGFWWQLWDKDGLAWHDRISGTRLRYYPGEPAAAN